MIDAYKEELNLLKEQMIAAEKFAGTLPIFAEDIIARKLTGSESWIQFGKRYKSLELA